LKQSKTNDQTEKGSKIKGSNYNFSGGLITKLQKHPRTKSKISFKVEKRCRFTEHCSLSSSEDVMCSWSRDVAAAKALICFNQGGMSHGRHLSPP